MEKQLDYLRYHSFLNAVSKEFEFDVDQNDPRIQKKLLALTMKIIDAFAEIYGDHSLKVVSNPVSKKLAAGKICQN